MTATARPPRTSRTRARCQRAQDPPAPGELRPRVPRAGVRSLPARACRRTHPQPGRAVQPRDQVRRRPRLGAAAGRDPLCHRPLCPPYPGRRWHRALQGRDAAKDQSYFLQRCRRPSLPGTDAARGVAQGRGAGAWPARRPARLRQARQHRDLLHRRAPFPRVPGEVPRKIARPDRVARRQSSSVPTKALPSTPSASAAACTSAGRAGHARGTLVSSRHKDAARNALIVVQGHDHPLLFRAPPLPQEPGTGWAPRVTEPFAGQVKARYRQADQAARLVPLRRRHLAILFEEPQRAVTPGSVRGRLRGDRASAALSSTSTARPSRHRRCLKPVKRAPRRLPDIIGGSPAETLMTNSFRARSTLTAVIAHTRSGASRRCRRTSSPACPTR